MGAHERTRVGREKARGPDPWLNGSALVFPRGQRERSTLANPRTDDALDTFVEYPQAEPTSFTIDQMAKDVKNKIREMGKKPASVGN
jgi:hypothetical protein